VIITNETIRQFVSQRHYVIIVHILNLRASDITRVIIYMNTS